MDQKAYWNQAAAAKEFTTRLPLELFRRFVAPEAAVLEIGCGYGRVLDELDQAGYRNLAGVDFSEKMIERGRAAHPRLNLRVSSGPGLDFPDRSFDAVLLFAVLTCLAADEDQRALIGEAERVLRPGGVIAVNDFLLNQDERNLTRYEHYEDQYGVYGVFEIPDGGVVRHHDPAWVFESLKAFETLHFEPVTYTTMNGHQSNGYHYFGRKRSDG